jgi:transcriptional repressor NrdR
VNKIKCPFCKDSETKVVDSRDSEDQTRRRRECEKCGKRFTTYEKVENINILVIKKDGRKEPFNREKMKRGIVIAGSKRISDERIEYIADEIENKLKAYESNEVPSQKIGEEVMNALKKEDKIAYIRFASIYKNFEDLDEFKGEIEKVLKRKGGI